MGKRTKSVVQICNPSTGHTYCHMFVLFFLPSPCLLQWGIADAEVKVPSDEDPEKVGM